MAATTDVWGMCRTCGAAVAPGRSRCALCGADRPLAAGEIASAPSAVRRRWRLTRAIRAVAVIGVVVALGAALIPPALSGPPAAPDPLTTAGAYRIAPGSYVAVGGEITGGDYVLGNYTAVTPYGASVALAVFNSTEWTRFAAGASATPVWSLPSQAAGRIVFSATYTDTYEFVVGNPYPVASGVSVTVYLVTQYESNVANDGFG